MEGEGGREASAGWYLLRQRGLETEECALCLASDRWLPQSFSRPPHAAATTTLRNALVLVDLVEPQREGSRNFETLLLRV